MSAAPAAPRAGPLVLKGGVALSLKAPKSKKKGKKKKKKKGSKRPRDGDGAGGASRYGRVYLRVIECKYVFVYTQTPKHARSHTLRTRPL